MRQSTQKTIKKQIFHYFFPPIDFIKQLDLKSFHSRKNITFRNVSTKFSALSPSNVRHIRCMHARPHHRKDQLSLRSLRARSLLLFDLA